MNTPSSSNKIDENELEAVFQKIIKDYNYLLNQKEVYEIIYNNLNYDLLTYVGGTWINLGDNEKSDKLTKVSQILSLEIDFDKIFLTQKIKNHLKSPVFIVFMRNLFAIAFLISLEKTITNQKDFLYFKLNFDDFMKNFGIIIKEKEFFENVWNIIGIFYGFGENRNCLYVHNLGRKNTNETYHSNSNLQKQRYQNMNQKHGEILENFCAGEKIDESIFFENQRHSDEKIYPMLFGEDLLKFSPVEKENFETKDLINGNLVLTSSNATKVETSHSYFSKTYSRSFFNPLIYGKENKKGGENIIKLVSKAQKTIQKQGSRLAFSEIISYLQIRNENIEKRGLVSILPLKYLEARKNDILGFRIVPGNRNNPAHISENQKKSYFELVEKLNLQENETLLPCNYLYLVYDAKTKTLITAYPIDENEVEKIRKNINSHNIQFIIS